MKLTTRWSLFHLGTLAAVLAGFSVALFLLATAYLSLQVDERLSAALDTLDAAVDREPEGLEWDIQDKHLPLGQEARLDAVRWEVCDGQGKQLDRSANLGEAGLTSRERKLPEDVLNHQATDGRVDGQRDGLPWRLAWRRVRSPSTPQAKSGGTFHSELMLTAGACLQPMHATLRGLAVALLALSAGVWALAALTGRWVGRRAVAPVTRMAAAARGMGGADLQQRLPGPSTPDEVGELHDAFNGLLDRLEEAFERQRRFSGDASHQLRTPLTAMLGQIEVVLRRERSAEEYRAVLEVARDHADQLRRIVEALLFLARADAEAQLAGLETVDLASWLPRHLQGWAEHVRAGDLRVECSGEAPVRVQAVLLGQLLDNLLDNAFKYSEKGFPVAVSVERQAEAITLAVRDAGTGIGPLDLPHVFDAFYRTEEARRSGGGGVGLGLAMARRIAQALGGTLAVESELGKGSRFVLRLPLPPNDPS